MNYRLIDMDNHYYEPDDCFSRHIESAYADLAIRPAPGGQDRWTGETRDDLGWWAMGDQRLRFTRSNLYQVALRPGAMLGVLEGTRPLTAVDQTTAICPKRDLPESFDRQSRLALLDKQGVEATLMIPSTGVMVEYDFRQQPAAVAANFRSFNRWLEEDWGFGQDRRIFGVPIISLLNIDDAMAELTRVADRGAKFFYFKLGPVNGQSPANPYFDPFWKAVAETGLHPVLHIDSNGYADLCAPMWGESTDLPAHRSNSAFLRFIADIWRPAQETVAALILQDLFGRFPTIQVLIVECGSEWLPPALKFMDKAAKSAGGVWAEGRRQTDGKSPSEIFSDHFYISPFPEDDIVGLAQAIGAERVLFGSDWPHSEGLEEPLDYLQRLEGLSDDEVRRIMRSNGAQLLGLPQ